MALALSRRILGLLAALCLLSFMLTGCQKGGPDFKDSPNPLPNYIKNYDAQRKYVSVKYCVLLNKSSRRVFWGRADTVAGAKKVAQQECLLKSSYNRPCTFMPKYRCGDRQILKGVKEDE